MTTWARNNSFVLLVHANVNSPDPTGVIPGGLEAVLRPHVEQRRGVVLDEGEARGQTEGGGRHDAEPQVPEGSGHHLVVLSGPGPVAQQSEDWGLLKMKMGTFHVVVSPMFT